MDICRSNILAGRKTRGVRCAIIDMLICNPKLDLQRRHIVQIFRANRNDVQHITDLNPRRARLLTGEGPNKSAAQKYCHVSDEENYNALESRIRFVLHIAEKEKVDTLILGAYGAGVFGQDATEVAQIFKRLLIEEFWTFEKIIFAIPDCSRNKNYKKFLDVMSDTIM